LIVVVVRDEIFDGIIRKKRLELLIKLCGESFVVSQDERRELSFLDYVGYCECFSATGYAEKHLVFYAFIKVLDELGDSLGLIAFGDII
jgi:hypothetical protein